MCIRDRGFVEMPHCLEYRSQYGDVNDYGERAARELEKVILREGAETVGAVVLEPITAGGGVILPPEGYWETIQQICRQYDVFCLLYTSDAADDSLRVDLEVCRVNKHPYLPSFRQGFRLQ